MQFILLYPSKCLLLLSKWVKPPKDYLCTMGNFITPLILLSVLEMMIIVYLSRLVRSLRRQEVQTAPAEVTEADEEADEQEPPKMARIVISGNEQQFLNRFKEVVFEEMGRGKVEIETLADRMCISRSQLNRKINALTGMSTSNYSIQLRLGHACKLLLEDTDTPIGEIALHCGFDDAAYFTRIFKRRIGVAPTAYRKNTDATSSEFGLKELHD